MLQFSGLISSLNFRKKKNQRELEPEGVQRRSLSPLERVDCMDYTVHIVLY